MSDVKIRGYRRKNGTYGIRNHLLVIPTSVCASEVATRVANASEQAVAIPHQHGCCQMGADFRQTVRTLVGFGINPNVGAVLVIGLGCEGIQANQVADEIRASGKPVDVVIIQDEGGSVKAQAEGINKLEALESRLNDDPVEEIPFSSLIVGLECGGSDPTSGIAANPAIGSAAERIVNAGGSSILSETTEVIGAEHILVHRFKDEKQAARFLEMVEDVEKKAVAMGEDLRGSQPTPGNIQGGLTTIEEKSLGCMFKAGQMPFEGVLEYSELLPLDRPGLYFMDTPGEDIDSITGMVAGGAQIVLFSTGRGTPTGCAIAPVIKITGNPDTFRRMRDNIDVDAGQIVEGRKTVDELGQEIFDRIVDVSNGDLTTAEVLGHKEFGIYRIGHTF